MQFGNTQTTKNAFQIGQLYRKNLNMETRQAINISTLKKGFVMEVCNTHSTKHYLDKHHRTVSIWRLFTQKGTQNKNTTEKKNTKKTQQKDTSVFV